MVCSITEAELNSIVAKTRMMVKEDPNKVIDRKLQEADTPVETSGYMQYWDDEDP